MSGMDFTTPTFSFTKQVEFVGPWVMTQHALTIIIYKLYF